MADLCARLDHYALANVQRPMVIDVTAFSWEVPKVDHFFSANTAHILSWDAVCSMFFGIGKILHSGVFALYGPFNRGGAYTSAGNRNFDQILRSRNSEMCSRNDADLVELGNRAGLTLVEDIAMPANYRVLIWQCTTASECDSPDQG